MAGSASTARARSHGKESCGEVPGHGKPHGTNRYCGPGGALGVPVLRGRVRPERSQADVAHERGFLDPHGLRPSAGASAASNLLGILPAAGRACGVGAAVSGSAVATYTAVLLADTAVPTWHDAHRIRPFVFASSAAASAGGMAAALAPVPEAGPARRMAVGGALLETLLSLKMERNAHLSTKTLRHGRAGTLMRLSKACTVGAGRWGLRFGGSRSRAVSTVSGIAVAAGPALLRFGVFEAGQGLDARPQIRGGPPA